MIYIYFDEDKDKRIIPIARVLHAYLSGNNLFDFEIKIQERKGTIDYCLIQNYTKFPQNTKIIKKEIKQIIKMNGLFMDGDDWDLGRSSDEVDFFINIPEWDLKIDRFGILRDINLKEVLK